MFCWKIRVMKRVPEIFKIKYAAFNWKSEVDILKEEGTEAFVNSKKEELRTYLETENEFFRIKGHLGFNIEEVIQEMVEAKRLLVPALLEQLAQLEVMKKLRKERQTLLESQKVTRPAKSRELSKLQSNSWFKFVKDDDEYELVDLKIVAYLRNSAKVLQADVYNYVRALTRGAISSSAETIVEQLLSRAKRQNRENLDWKNLLVELQFCALGPKKHEEVKLKEQLMDKLKADKNMRATVQDVARGRTRSPHIKFSNALDR